MEKSSKCIWLQMRHPCNMPKIGFITLSKQHKRKYSFKDFSYAAKSLLSSSLRDLHPFFTKVFQFSETSGMSVTLCSGALRLLFLCPVTGWSPDHDLLLRLHGGNLVRVGLLALWHICWAGWPRRLLQALGAAGLHAFTGAFSVIKYSPGNTQSSNSPSHSFCETLYGHGECVL